MSCLVRHRRGTVWKIDRTLQEEVLHHGYGDEEQGRNSPRLNRFPFRIYNSISRESRNAAWKEFFQTALKVGGLQAKFGRQGRSRDIRSKTVIKK